ncbi:MAG: response regulator [Deltaproteobacteria bacterium]|nr:response regulator [Deltaproteobacteria bacterium]MBI3386967.1 response regulator [Deltaproteobacteria bacterium]
MKGNRTSITIVMADDDQEDCIMTRDALAESRVVNDLRFVQDGEELMDYLLRRGSYEALGAAPRPGLILLDLNMPRKDGREALRQIKGDAQLRDIPIVVLTTSKSEEDILRSYTSGASSFITKPVTFGGLVEVMKTLGQYWFDIVDLPMQP